MKSFFIFILIYNGFLFSQSKDAIENAIQASLIPRIEVAISGVFSNKKIEQILAKVKS